MPQKLRLAVLCGGVSSEHDVSLRSAAAVGGALSREKYDVTFVVISRSGAWYIVDDLSEAADVENSGALCTWLAADGNRTLWRMLAADASQFRLEPAGEIDVVFPVLHGPRGEDGTVQGLLELSGVPYVGAGVAGSAVGMDKALFKRIMEAHRLPVLRWRCVLRRDLDNSSEQLLDAIESEFTYPVFTKPANLGSSVGVSRCDDRSELMAGLRLAFRFDCKTVVEQGIDATELEVAVLGNDAPQASVVGEIRPKRRFYDYVAKYVSGDSQLMIPAEVPAHIAEQTRRLALQAYTATDCQGMARVDFLLDRATQNLYVNEINTIPGFTAISMFPKLWEASGLSFGRLVDRLVELALERSQAMRQTRAAIRFEDGPNSDPQIPEV
jgi:D-alanine-D-alanine ligase